MESQDGLVHSSLLPCHPQRAALRHCDVLFVASLVKLVRWEIATRSRSYLNSCETCVFFFDVVHLRFSCASDTCGIVSKG